MLGGGDDTEFRQLADSDDAGDSNFGSVVSGNFGMIKAIKTPGFTADKKFSFSGNDNN